MDTDLAFVSGIVLAALALPSFFSALADNRRPRVAVVMAVVAGGLIVWAVRSRPGGYTIMDIPEAFVRVMARFLA